MAAEVILYVRGVGSKPARSFTYSSGFHARKAQLFRY